jgi:hypothetical protein
MTPPPFDAERAAIQCANSRHSCGGCDWQHYCEATRREIAQRRHQRAEDARRHPPMSYRPEDDDSRLDALYKAY